MGSEMCIRDRCVCVHTHIHARTGFFQSAKIAEHSVTHSDTHKLKTVGHTVTHINCRSALTWIHMCVCMHVHACMHVSVYVCERARTHTSNTYTPRNKHTHTGLNQVANISAGCMACRSWAKKTKILMRQRPCMYNGKDCRISVQCCK